MSLFQARIHSLESLQRVRVSTDDGNSSADYLEDRRIITNAFSVTTPYRVGFRCFQGELSTVLNSLAAARDFVVVKTMLVENTAEYAVASADQTTNAPPPTAPTMTPGGQPLPAKKGVPVVPAKAVVFPVVLDNKPIKVTMLIEIVRPLKLAAVKPAN
jgi:hypothetical protein